MKGCLFILLFIEATYCQNLGPSISASELFEVKKEIKIVDFRGEDARDLDGYIEDSIVIPDEKNEETENKIRSV